MIRLLLPKYQSINLSEKEKFQFAEQTINMVWNGVMFEPEKILTPRRSVDTDDTLWNVMNRIQENIIKGGISYTLGESNKNRRATTKSIRNIDRNTNINLMLWSFMESFYKTGSFN